LRTSSLRQRGAIGFDDAVAAEIAVVRLVPEVAAVGPDQSCFQWLCEAERQRFAQVGLQHNVGAAAVGRATRRTKGRVG
jgi:hypothetical protein